jgi:hypothetical protein
LGERNAVLGLGDVSALISDIGCNGLIDPVIHLFISRHLLAIHTICRQATLLGLYVGIRLLIIADSIDD